MKETNQFWWDFRHNADGTLDVGIESSDKSLTFDGHYVCILPSSGDETADDAIVRAQRIVDLLNGKTS